MKTVLLVRHAKSSWDDPLLADFDRPLAARGRGAAPRIARYMRDKGLIPDLVACSTVMSLDGSRSGAFIEPGGAPVRSA